jgi:hypothetical protein
MMGERSVHRYDVPINHMEEVRQWPNDLPGRQYRSWDDLTARAGAFANREVTPRKRSLNVDLRIRCRSARSMHGLAGTKQRL